ncbi:MAG TPA: hypothetical protein VE958_08065 [Bryobacteraceae bacterium]|nr:hypothetical protein [Bryobacteraceae bacterium]
MIWQPQPGPQTAAILSEADEILLGGARGGGKTLAGILWLLKGNYDLPEGHPVRNTAVNWPHYRALVVRRNAQDLRDWIDQAWEIFKDTGAKKTGQPVTFEWPSHAKIYTDHLNDEDAFNKYRGWSLTRILLEELTEIPYAKWYLRLFGSLRARKQGDGSTMLKTQILATTNPDGPGMMWVKRRFVEVYAKGARIPPNTTFRDPLTKLTRVFIPALLDDNKFLGPEYEQQLLAQRGESEAIYQAWRWGRWDVFSGQFYDTYRPDGNREGEPVWAKHTYDAADVVLAPYWPMAIGVDWGYNHDSAAYWGRWNQQDKRLYVFREFVARQMGSRQLGQEIARRTLPDIFGLGDQAHVPLFLSHDAFSKEDNTRTRAELFAEGVEDVLGQGSTHIVDLTDGEKKMDAQAAFEASTNRLRSLSNGAAITIHKARSDRPAMAAYTREMLNWRVLEQKPPDMDYARRLLAHDNGMAMADEYLARFRDRKEPDPVPKLKIERSCVKLKNCLLSMVYDETNTEAPMKVNSTADSPGDDPHDALWYLLMGARMTVNRKPRSVFIDERLAKFSDHGDPAIRYQILQKANEDYGRIPSSMEPFSVDRLM